MFTFSSSYLLGVGGIHVQFLFIPFLRCVFMILKLFAMANSINLSIFVSFPLSVLADCIPFLFLFQYFCIKVNHYNSVVTSMCPVSCRCLHTIDHSPRHVGAYTNNVHALSVVHFYGGNGDTFDFFQMLVRHHQSLCGIVSPLFSLIQYYPSLLQ